MIVSQFVRTGRIHYSWVIFVVAFVTLLFASGTRSTPSILMVPLESEFGWTRATVSLAVSINLVLFGFVGPFAAAMMNRWGIQRVVASALIFVAAGAALTTLMTEPWQLYLLWGVVVGIGAGTMATVFAATVANRWFVAKRGLVVGVLTAASATGQLIFLPLFGWLAQTQGWRYVSLTVAVCTLAVVPLVLIFMRDRPESVGIRAYGAKEDDPPAPVRANPIAAAFQGLAMASSNRNFWVLAATFFICGATTNGLIGTHLIPAGMDRGMEEVAAASLLAVIGIFDIVGTTFSGWLTDRVDSRRLLFVYYGFRGPSLLLLPAVLGSPGFGLVLFVVFYGLDWIATVPPTVALSSQTFGLQNGPLVYGWIFTAHQLGAAAAASSAGVIRTVTGGYEYAFVGGGALCLIAAMLCLLFQRTGEISTVTPMPLAGPLVRPAVAGRR